MMKTVAVCGCFLHRRSRFQVMTTITHLPMLTRMGLYVQLNVVVAVSVPDMPLYAGTELVKPMHLRRCQTVTVPVTHKVTQT